MPTFLIILHAIVCICLLGLILLQTGKGAQAGATFGNGASSSFGSTSPASFFVKLTAFVGVLYFITSMSLGIFKGESSATKLLENVSENAQLAGLNKSDDAAEAEFTSALDAQRDNDLPEINILPKHSD